MRALELFVVLAAVGAAVASAQLECDESARVAACRGAYEYCARRVAAAPPAPPVLRDAVLARQAAEYPELRAAQERTRVAHELCVLCLPALALCLDRAGCARAPGTAFARYADQCANVSQCARCLFVAAPRAPRVALPHLSAWLPLSVTLLVAALGLPFLARRFWL